MADICIIICTTISGNVKLASRYTTDDENKEKTPQIKYIVLIETRGREAMLCCTTYGGIRFIGREEIPTITPEQREAILTSRKVL